MLSGPHGKWFEMTPHFHPTRTTSEEPIMRESNGQYATLSDRIRAIRIDRFGDDGASVLASLMGITEGKLTRMEINGPIPGHLILAFIVVTDASPGWLLTGAGEWYSQVPVTSARRH
jgi:hypothetical protein